jgi:hypothetical protein
MIVCCCNVLNTIPDMESNIMPIDRIKCFKSERKIKGNRNTCIGDPAVTVSRQ